MFSVVEYSLLPLKVGPLYNLFLSTTVGMCLSVVTVPPLFATMLPQGLGTNLQLFQAPERQLGARESSVLLLVAGRVSEH